MIVRLFLRYNGADFNGWQIQNVDGKENPSVRTVQGTLTRALRTLLRDDTIAPVGSSRTDAGVHALDFCASFEVENPIVPPDRICYAIAHLLPDSITVYRSEIAPEGFHARFDTVSKTYKYLFYTGEFAVPSMDKNAWHVKTTEEPDENAMNLAARKICGTHYFDAFCGDPAAAKTTRRTVYECSVTRSPLCPTPGNTFWELTVTGDGFLYNMVRILTGTLVYVGLGKFTPEDVTRILESGDRREAGITAPPQGLYLYKVRYDR